MITHIVTKKPVPTLQAAEKEQVDDLLNRTELVETVSKFLDKANLPCTIAITGEWGVGKTTFLCLLEDNLRNNGHIPIRFDLWRYEATGNVLYALSQKLLEESGKEADKELKRQLLEAAALIGNSIFAIASTAAGMPILGITAGSAIALIKKELSSKRNTARVAENVYKSIDDLEKGFEKAIEAIIRKNKKIDKNCRVVILVDDIDRCFPSNVANLLTGIKNYLTSKKCAFVIAIDKDRAEAAINSIKHYDEAPGKWLEKLFTFEISLPEPSSSTRKNYLKGEIKKLIGEESFIDIFPRVQPQLEKIIDFLPPNPRRWNKICADAVYLAFYFDRPVEDLDRGIILLVYKYYFPEIFRAISFSPKILRLIKARINIEADQLITGATLEENTTASSLVKSCRNRDELYHFMEMTEPLMQSENHAKEAFSLLQFKGLV